MQGTISITSKGGTMKTALIVCLLATGLLLLAVAGTPQQSTVSENPEPGYAIQAVESGQLEALFAQGGGGASDNNDVQGMYNELKKIAKEYHNATRPEAKSGLSQRADNLMGILFDAKVQKETKRIDVLERRLKGERDRLKQMQSHKLDLVHKGVQKLLDSGGQEVPEWATPQQQ
jgi:hypothetical protein